MASWLSDAAYMGFKEDFSIPQKAASVPRFGMLICGMFCSIAIGALYAYSLITSRLTNDFHFTQNDITTVSTVGIVIGYFTFPFGMLYDYIGPKPIFALGILCNVLGTVLFALVFDDKIGHSVGGLAIINAIMNLGCALFDMGSILTVLSWFPLDRGLVVACMKTTTGLGGSFVSTLYSTYFNNNNTSYMYFLTAWSAFIGTVAIIVIYLPPYHLTGSRAKHHTIETRRRSAAYEAVYMRHKAPIKRFAITFALVVSLLVVICTRSVVFVYIDNPTMSQKNPPAILMIILYVLLLGVALPFPWLDKQPWSYDSDSAAGYEADRLAILQRQDEGNDGQANEPAAAELEKLDSPGAGNVDDMDRTLDAATKPKRSLWQQVVDAVKPEVVVPTQKEPTTYQEVQQALSRLKDEAKIPPQFPTGFLFNIRRPTLLCLWLTGFCVSGVVNVVLMNSTQIYLAVSENPGDTVRPALYVALTSIGSAVGRLVMAFLEVFTQRTPPERRIPLTVFYCIPPLLCAMSCILFLFIPTPGLLAPMLFGGLGNGFYAAAEVLTVRTIFSIDVAKHYNSLFFFEMLAVIFMNRLLFGEIMTRNSTYSASGVPQCLGRKACIQTTFIVLTCLSVVGLISSAFMHFTYVRFAKVEYVKRREKQEALEMKLKEMSNEVAERSEPTPSSA